MIYKEGGAYASSSVVLVALVASFNVACRGQGFPSVPTRSPPPDCRNLAVTPSNMFVAGRPEFQALRPNQLAVVTYAGGGPRILACSALNAGYVPRPMEYRCEAFAQNSAQLSFFARQPTAPMFQAIPVTVGATAGQAYVFSAGTHLRFDAAVPAVFRNQLQGPDCFMAQAFVRAFVVGDYQTRQVGAIDGAFSAGPVNVGGSGSAQVVDGGTSVPLTVEFAPLSDLGTQQCAWPRKPAPENPAICVIDEISKNYRIRLSFNASGSVCDELSACDFNAKFQRPDGEWEIEELPKDSNTATYDMPYVYTAANLLNGITIRAFDRDLLNPPEYLGECAVRLPVAALRSAADGVPYERTDSCGKFKLTYVVTAM